jgi:voltage-gated potassium channel
VIDSLSDHYVICGFGRVGRQIVRDLRAAGARYVVIDPNGENREAAARLDAPFIEGSAWDDDVLRVAGIERARGVIACIDSDADNVFVTLTARELRSDITIVARASLEDSEKKLRRAGADRVISPYKASGSEMARAALHPQVSELQIAPEYRVAEIEAQAGCAGIGQTIEDVRGSSVIVALRRRNGPFLPQPPGDAVLRAGDTLIAVGTTATMDRLESLFTRAGTPDAASES